METGGPADSYSIYPYDIKFLNIKLGKNVLSLFNKLIFNDFILFIINILYKLKMSIHSLRQN